MLLVMPSSDTSRFAAPLPRDEADRQRAVDDLDIVDTPREAAFDDIVGLAAALCGTPDAAFTVLSEQRQWFKAEVGLDATETPRDLAFCGWTILDTSPLVVEDTLLDRRFREHPSVLEGLKIRFYVGLPIAAPDGQPVGSLCVMDSVPRHLSPLQRQTLRVLANQIQTQLALRSSLQHQRVLAQRKEELTQLIVHDLKSPLGAIVPNAQFIVQQSDAVVVAEAASEIALAADRMNRMVLDVLDVSRSEGELPLSRSPTDVRELLHIVQSQFAARAAITNVHLHITDGPTLTASLDRQLMLRVFDNLIDNAIKYGRSRIDIDATTVDDTVVIVIADDGPGIPPADRRRIFARNQRLRIHEHHESSSSRGLGLCFCALAIGAHGGTITVDDNVPHGSRFRIVMPLTASS